MRKRIASAVAVGAIALVTALGGATTASATDPDDAPPGYAGPFSTCSGQLVYHIPWDRVIVNGVDHNNGWDYIC
ncbi:hypothetical protein [Saccharothrix lopnurensis]|uniref:Secreted protein n=1 Tax=Saccharothrix lopnurensis TaxID=1670621 RepID=A0ABW1P2A3_9PSEU